MSDRQTSRSAMLRFEHIAKTCVLQVIVSNSVIMQELTFRQEELVTKLQRMLPQHRITSVRFRVGSVA